MSHKRYRPVVLPHMFLMVFGCALAAGTAMRPACGAPPDAKRIDELSSLLPKSPQGVGPTIAQRRQWQAVAEQSQFKTVVAAARRRLAEPLPELTDELYLDYSRTGNRTRAQKVISQRHGRLNELVLAECLENQGKFLPGIEATIRALCAEKAWTLPAHDRSLSNFRGSQLDIDLHVAGAAWNLATADYWLGDKLSAETRGLIRAELKKRVFDPFEGYLQRGQPRMWWPTTTNNWNAVCLAGVTGTALATLESPRQRAFYVAAAEKYIDNFLAGFTPDGYCSEGLGYWNYGFGHFVMLAETLHQATGGKLDLLTRPKVRQIAEFGRHLEILPGVYPALADCRVGSQPDPVITAYVLRRLQVPLQPQEARGLSLGVGASRELFQFGLFGFANAATAAPPAAQPAAARPLRDYFADAGILICRPRSDAPAAFGAAFKGGHNAEHHNHNDVGSFVVALGKTTPLVDPGSEVYTARTFSAKRYDSNVLNSFGHPVPRIAGQLQREGRQAAAKVLKAEFTDQADTFVLDIKTPYAVKALQELQRTFVFSRQGSGSVQVIDEVEFESPQTFETALITFAEWRQAAPNRLVVGEPPEAVQVAIDAGGAAFRVDAQPIKEDLPGGRIPTRLGIVLGEPVAKARVQLTITPAVDKENPQ